MDVGTLFERAARQVQNVDLTSLGEGDTLAVGRELGVGFSGLGLGQAAQTRAGGAGKKQIATIGEDSPGAIAGELERSKAGRRREVVLAMRIGFGFSVVKGILETCEIGQAG